MVSEALASGSTHGVDNPDGSACLLVEGGAEYEVGWQRAGLFEKGVGKF